MQFIDYTHPLPAVNLALEEWLLNQVNDGVVAPMLRVWESPSFFVVLGYSSSAEEDVHLKICHQDHIPVLRRISGGGTVLQGPGCLNYALIGQTDGKLDLNTTTCESLNRLCRAFSPLPLLRKGISDVVIRDKKCIGNAERRKKNAYLYHGSILYNFNIELMERYLKMPPKQPDYRNRRTHQDFVTNLPLSADEIKQRLRREFCSVSPSTQAPRLPSTDELKSLLSSCLEPDFIYRR